MNFRIQDRGAFLFDSAIAIVVGIYAVADNSWFLGAIAIVAAILAGLAIGRSRELLLDQEAAVDRELTETLLHQVEALGPFPGHTPVIVDNTVQIRPDAEVSE